MIDDAGRSKRLVRGVRRIDKATELLDFALDEWSSEEGTKKLQDLLTRLRLMTGRIRFALNLCGGDEIEEFAYEQKVD